MRTGAQGLRGRAPVRGREHASRARARGRQGLGKVGRAPSGRDQGARVAAPLAEPVLSRAAARTPENMASVNISVMEGTVQSLPERLRTRNPGAWTFF